jgi:hypothetical protein
VLIFVLIYLRISIRMLYIVFKFKKVLVMAAVIFCSVMCKL